MGNNNILFKNLDKLLRRVYEYSTTLGDWGKYVWIFIYLGSDESDGYSARSFVVKPDKIYEHKQQKVCNSCYEDVYVSEYDPTTNNHSIYINKNIDTIEKNSKEIKELIRNIEILGIDAYNIIRNRYLDSERHPKLLIYFERIISNEKKIIEEIKRSIIFGQSISDKRNKYEERPVFKFMALKGSKTNIYNGRIELNFPNYYKFIYTIYG